METTFSDYKEYRAGNQVLRVMHDENPISPRDCDNLGTMYCWHKRYALGDYKKTDFPPGFKLDKRKVIYLPVYIYDHGGITVSTSPFQCLWDSGQVGWIFVEKERVRNEWGVKKISPKLKQRVIGLLEGEVKTYDQFLRGDVYCFQIFESKVCEMCGHEKLEQIDTCGSFYGDDHQKNGMIDNLSEGLKKEVLEGERV